MITTTTKEQWIKIADGFEAAAKNKIYRYGDGTTVPFRFRSGLCRAIDDSFGEEEITLEQANAMLKQLHNYDAISRHRLLWPRDAKGAECRAALARKLAAEAVG